MLVGATITIYVPSDKGIMWFKPASISPETFTTPTKIVLKRNLRLLLFLFGGNLSDMRINFPSESSLPTFPQSRIFSYKLAETDNLCFVVIFSLYFLYSLSQSTRQ